MSTADNSTRRFRFSLAALLFLMLCVASTLIGFRIGFERGHTAGAEKRQSEQPTTRVYDVRDLVLADIGNPSRVVADYDSLIELINSSVAEETWADVGGPGTISAFPKTYSLLINQTSEVHEKIAELLEQLRAAKPAADP